MPLLTFKMPGFLLVFFRYLNFMNFRFNDQKAYIAKHYDFTTSMQVDGITHFVAGFDTSNVFINLYDLLVFFFIGCPVILVILFTIYFIACLQIFPTGNFIARKTGKMLEHIRYNSLIRIISESILSVLVSAYLNLKKGSPHATQAEAIGCTLSILLIVIFTCFPIFVAKVLFTEKAQLLPGWKVHNKFNVAVSGLKSPNKSNVAV